MYKSLYNSDHCTISILLGQNYTWLQTFQNLKLKIQNSVFGRWSNQPILKQIVVNENISSLLNEETFSVRS